MVERNCCFSERRGTEVSKRLVISAEREMWTVEEPDRRSDRLGHDRALRRDGASAGLTIDSDRST